jgi:hypothetical protein
VTARYAMLTIECGHCGSHMKKLQDAMRIADVYLTCVGCETHLRVSREDIRTELARRRLQVLGSDCVPARPEVATRVALVSSAMRN